MQSNPPRIPEAWSHLRRARLFLDAYKVNGLRVIRRHKGMFYRWCGTRYEPLTDEILKALLYRYFDDAVLVGADADDRGEPYGPDKAEIERLYDATKAEAALSDNFTPPCWLVTDIPMPDARETVAFANALVHLPTGECMPHSPAFFSLNSLPFDYNPDAPEPSQWLSFLASVWPDDQETVETLQEWFGLCLTSDTSHHKALLIVGPPRSGKGTIARVLTALLGQDNVCGPTLNSLGGTFGLQPLLGKLLAIVSDARLDTRTSRGVVTERLLSITGEDSLSVDRKNRQAWDGRLTTRLMLLTNELPRVDDMSGALASRFILLQQVHSFLGKEDRGLVERIIANEMPAIMAWALKGMKRLAERGYFRQPAAANHAVKQLAETSSPIRAFLNDCCESGTGDECTVQKRDLFDAWRRYCDQQGWKDSGSEQEFGRKLHSAVPTIATGRPTKDNPKRLRYYKGVQLNAKWYVNIVWRREEAENAVFPVQAKA